MPTHRELILAYLRQHPEGADDDALSATLRIRPRQTVNQVCRALEKQGMVSRRPGSLSGKLTTVLVGNQNAAPPIAPTLQSVAVPQHTNPTSARMILLENDVAVQDFGYRGECGLSEDEVKKAVSLALRSEGWEVETRFGHSHGIDIDARRSREHLVAEAKGEGSLNPMRVNYFLGALGELVQRMESPDACYGLALPAHRQFVGLVMRLPAWARTRLGLCFLLVRPGAQGGYDVGFLPPQSTSPTSKQS